MGFDIDTYLAKATDTFTAGRSYGPVIEQEGTTVIPAAFVIGAGGGGGGEGPPEGDGAGSGGGGGWFGLSWPVGAYVIKGGEARWVPAFDATRIAAAALGIAGAMLKLRSKRRSG